MSVHLERQFERLKKSLISLSELVESSVRRAIEAAEKLDADLAGQVLAGDEQIDLMEVEIEEECLHTLALHQPVAFDLRFAVAALKINNDLERIGDLAANIAEQAGMLAAEPQPSRMPFDLHTMGAAVREMLTRSLAAWANVDPDAAEAVRDADEQVDATHRATYKNVAALMREDPEQTRQLIRLLNISRHLERIADHCVNIAEDVLYMARAEITRHGGMTEERPSTEQ